MARSKLSLLGVILLFASCNLSTWAQAPDLLYLQFNEGTGTTTADQAVPGTAALPSLQGAAGWDSAPALGASALLLGPGATNADHAQTNNPFSLSGSWTLEFWFRNDDTGTGLRYILGDNSAGSFRVYKSGSSPASILIAGTGMTGVTATAAAPVGQWVHVAFVYDDVVRDLRVYIDGVDMGSKLQASNLSFTGTSANGLLIGGYSTSAATVGAIDEVRLYSFARSAGTIARERNAELMSFPADVAISQITAPASSAGCDPLTATETLSFNMRNVGSGALPIGTVVVGSYSIDGAPAVTEVFLTTTLLNTSAVESFSFLTPADLSQVGLRSLSVSATVTADLNNANDAALRSIRSGGEVVIAAYPHLENFDSVLALNTTTPPLGWQQDLADGGGTGGDLDWYFRSGATSSSNTGPSADFTSGSGSYAYVEDSSGNHPQINLISPCFDLASLSNPTLQFALHSMNGSTSGPTVNENFISVDLISYPGGVVNLDLVGPIGDQGSAWTTQTAALSAFSGQTIQLRFRGRSDGGSFTHDIAIDDVQIFDALTTVGQAPRAGLSSFDLNSAVNVNLAPVSSGAKGPYAAAATAGAGLTFDFDGEAMQPILLLFGASNPVSATYPGGIGQFDIGGAVDALGIPTGLSVVADGFQPTTLLYAIFNTGPSGALSLTFQAPPLPPGWTGGFQSVLRTNQSFGVALSNAVDLTFF